MGNGNFGQSIIVFLCCSFLITIFPCSGVGSLPCNTVLQKLLQYGFPARHSQEQPAPAWVPCGLWFLPENLHGLLWTGRRSVDCVDSCQKPAAAWAHRPPAGPPQAAGSFGASLPAAVWCPPQAAVQISAPLWWSTGSRGQLALLWSLQDKLKGILRSSTWSTSSPPDVCRAVSLTFFFSLLSRCCYASFFTLS